MLSDTYNDYRPDIDGLRAIAVLSVIFFHLNYAHLPGGFIGVDIFFVISGYLISLHIFKDIRKGRFSILEFYKRRVKRIAPAMLVVVFVTIASAQFLLRPIDAEKVAESGLWSLLSLGNVYFWLYQDTGYFAQTSNELPLSHLWSLGVEEQFYIFWPLMLLATYRIGYGKYFFLLFSLIVLASVFLAEHLFARDPSFVYYMLPTRAGELLMGALLALVILKRGTIKIPETLVALVSWTGLVMISGSLICLNEELVFPGLRAIPPTLGAAMLIFAGHFGRSWPSRFLMLKPMVWIGLISYSAYLWHWPILAFLRYSNTEISFFFALAIFAMTMLLAWASYLYVETPGRRLARGSIQVITLLYIVPCGLVGVIALASMKLDGYGLRWFSEDYKLQLAKLRDATKPAYEYDYVCQSQVLTYNDVKNPHCVIGDDHQSSTSAILWGDSNAAHYIGLVGVFAHEGGFKFRNLEIGSCPPLFSDADRFASIKRAPDCNKSWPIAFEAINKYPVVIISASWSSYQSRSEDFLNAFFQTVLELANKGKLVILVGKAPVISTYDRLCWEKAISFPFVKCDTSSVSFPTEVAEINQKLKYFSQHTENVEYYSINEHLCPDGTCSAFNKDGKVIYYDSDHLTLEASWQIGSDIYEKEGVPFPFTLIPGWAIPSVSEHEQ